MPWAGDSRPLGELDVFWDLRVASAHLSKGFLGGTAPRTAHRFKSHLRQRLEACQLWSRARSFSTTWRNSWQNALCGSQGDVYGCTVFKIVFRESREATVRDF